MYCHVMPFLHAHAIYYNIIVCAHVHIRGGMVIAFCDNRSFLMILMTGRISLVAIKSDFGPPADRDFSLFQLFGI